MHSSCTLVVRLTLCVAATFGPVTGGGWGAKARQLDWATSAGGGDPDVGNGIATDPCGRIYVTGNFAGQATFGAGETNETVLRSEGGNDVFVAKYGRDGTLLWATRAGGPDGASGIAIATDPRGRIYVTGNFRCQATFGASEANETVLTGGGLFVAKYARNGTLLWATRAGGGGITVGHGIATDPRGNSYVTGIFDGQARFGAGEANETVLRDAGNGDMFVAKYARNGALLWAKSAGGGFSAQGRGIATDPRGNSYVTGSFGNRARFGAGEANETVLTGGNVFVAKYARDGTLVWATSAGGGIFDEGRGIATDPFGNSYVTGFFERQATFGAGEANETVLTGNFTEMFVAKYARDGTLPLGQERGRRRSRVVF